MSRASITLLFSLLISYQVNAETFYVSDVLRITVRSGPTTDNEILETVSSGTSLETTGEESDGWVPVRTPRGIEGYVVTRYLMDEPIARDQLTELQAQLQSIQAEPDSLRSRMLQVQEENNVLATQNDELSLEVQQMAEQLATSEEISSNTFEINSERDELRQERDQLLVALDEARLEKTVLEDQSDEKWTLVGAGILFLGIILGLILPGLRSRRTSNWSSSSF